jgi:Mrp family chromosome partitioning ATPase
MGCVLLAEAAATWTDKEVLIAGGKLGAAILTCMVPLVTLAIHLATHHLQKKAQQAEEARAAAQQAKVEAEQAQVEAEKGRLGAETREQDALGQVGQAMLERKELETRLAGSEDRRGRLMVDLAASQDNARTLTQRLDVCSNELGACRAESKRQRSRVLKALSSEGRSWCDKVLTGAPPFRPLAERRTPIISILNLKGGVGKTTLTGNLAAALDELGYRVLLLDLDLQGSLSGLFLSHGDKPQVLKSERLLANFLLRSIDSNLHSAIGPLDYFAN